MPVREEKVEFSPLSSAFLESSAFRSQFSLWSDNVERGFQDFHRITCGKSSKNFLLKASGAFWAFKLSSVESGSFDRHRPFYPINRISKIWINSCVIAFHRVPLGCCALSLCGVQHCPRRIQKLPKMNWYNFIYEYHDLFRLFIHASYRHTQSGSDAREKQKH